MSARYDPMVDQSYEREGAGEGLILFAGFEEKKPNSICLVWLSSSPRLCSMQLKQRYHLHLVATIKAWMVRV